MEQLDLVIIGGGPAGLAAAVSAWDNGVRSMIGRPSLAVSSNSASITASAFTVSERNSPALSTRPAILLKQKNGESLIG